MTSPATRPAPAAAAEPAPFDAGERRMLALIFETLIARHEPVAGDDPTLMRTGAGDRPILDYALGLFARIEPDDLRDMRRLLRLMETPAANLAIAGVFRRFSAMATTAREAYLRRLAASPVPQLRTGFQGLKRSACFLYYGMPDAGGQSPLWPAIGYPGPPNAAARTDGQARLTHIDQPTTVDAGVCVIGSGAGGGVVAAELAAAGQRVIVLEAGGGRVASDYDQTELWAMRDLYLDHGMTATKDLGVVIAAGATLGGGTAINWQTSLRTLDRIRDEWATEYGLGFVRDRSYDDSLDAVTRRLNAGTSESIVNANNSVIARGCTALGYRHDTIPRNARDCDPAQCGFCVHGCRHGGKQSTAVTFLSDAQSAGHDLTIIPNCRAGRIVFENGRATAVEATAMAAGGAAHAVRVNARVIVVSGGALHTPALLLRSGLDHPAIGQSLFLHPTTWLLGMYPERIGTWDGPPHTVYSDQFATLDGNFGFMIEAVPAHPGNMALGMPWFGSKDHRRLMRQAWRTAAFIPLVRDREGGRVRLSRTGRPLIEYQPGKQARAHLRRGITEGVRLHLAAGADTVVTLHTHHRGIFRRRPDTTRAQMDAFAEEAGSWPVGGNRCVLWSAHQMGTCAMGVDPKRSVCDVEGRVRGVANLYVADSSLFPSASGNNPMVTIMALAHHVARGIIATT